MDNIIEPNASFDFSKISLVGPVLVSGATYFTRLLYFGSPLYIQVPKCLTRQGFFKHGKKYACDLMFDNQSEDFITWLEHLENKCQEIIYEKSKSWFATTLDKNDIESAFNSSLKLYKSGKFYLLRTQVKTNSLTHEPMIKIFNEDETILSMEDIQSDTQMVTIVEIQGIRFTTRNFQIEFEIKQGMVMKSEPLFDTCMIKTRKTSPQPQPVLEPVSEPELEPVLEPELQGDLLFPGQNCVEEQPVMTLVKRNHDNSDDETEDDETEDDEDDDDHDDDDHAYKKDEQNLEDPKGKEDDLITQAIDTLKKKEEEEDNIHLEMEELGETDPLKEVDISPTNNLETMQLKKPNEVYYEIYKQARRKAKEAKKTAILAYLEARNIKKTYMLDDGENSDSDNDNVNDNDSDGSDFADMIPK
jgi:hypothetical protein